MADSVKIVAHRGNHIEPVLAIKLDTLRSDLTVEKEDRVAAELNSRRAGRRV